jgi:hypothetical protein
MPPVLLLLLLRDPPPLPLFRSPDEPMPRSLELELVRLSDGLSSENIARSLLVPRSRGDDDDSRFRMRSSLLDTSLLDPRLELRSPSD